MLTSLLSHLNVSAARALWDTLTRAPLLHRATLAVLLLAGIAFRFAFIFEPIRWDETFTFKEFASRPFLEAIGDYGAPNNHVFHTALVHISTRLFGETLWAIRLPALVAGLLLLPATYTLARSLFGLDVALITTSLTSASAALVEYSTNARGYTLITLFFVLALGVAANAARRRNWLAVVLVVLFSALGFYTVPTMLFGIGALGIWLVATEARDRGWQGPRSVLLPLSYGLGTVALSLLLYAWTIRVSTFQQVFWNGTVRAREGDFLPDAARGLAALSQSWTLLNLGFPSLLAWAILALALLGAVAHAPRAGNATLLALSVIGSSAALILAQRTVPPARVFLLFLPVYFSVASYGVVVLLQRLSPKAPSRLAPLLALAILPLAFWTVTTRGLAGDLRDSDRFPEASAIARYLASELRSPEDTRIIAPLPADLPLAWYLDEQGADSRTIVRRPGTAARIFLVVKEPRYTVAALVSQHNLLAPEWSEPEIVQTYSGASVALLRRRAT